VGVGKVLLLMRNNKLIMDNLNYLQGFGNEFATEALPGTLPLAQNSPQQVPSGLYAEQLSGTAFTMTRANNRRSWLYRILPSVVHDNFGPYHHNLLKSAPFSEEFATPNQLRWQPLPYSVGVTTFIDSLITFAGQGHVGAHEGAAIHLYAANHSMTDQYFYNADGELLIVPEEGGLRFHTEMGLIDVIPGEIAVIPRGIKFKVNLHAEKARGYVLENYGQPLQLPELGILGANALAHPRHFLTPVAAFEDTKHPCILLAKYQGKLFQAQLASSPLNVVAWHGNYAPYKYDLRLFNTINTVSFDHPDPSIFTVLTSPSQYQGIANVDFVIFPARWIVAEHTFRPPYYHRNIMSEYMGLIYGAYDAKSDGFVPGGGSLHNCMSPHGPDSQAFQTGMSQALNPQYLADTLAFMFESRSVWLPTVYAAQSPLLQKDYHRCWQSLPRLFPG